MIWILEEVRRNHWVLLRLIIFPFVAMLSIGWLLLQGIDIGLRQYLELESNKKYKVGIVKQGTEHDSLYHFLSTPTYLSVEFVASGIPSDTLFNNKGFDILVSPPLFFTSTSNDTIYIKSKPQGEKAKSLVFKQIRKYERLLQQKKMLANNQLKDFHTVFEIEDLSLDVDLGEIKDTLRHIEEAFAWLILIIYLWGGLRAALYTSRTLWDNRISISNKTFWNIPLGAMLAVLSMLAGLLVASMLSGGGMVGSFAPSPLLNFIKNLHWILGSIAVVSIALWKIYEHPPKT